MNTREVILGNTACCANCSKRASFQPVVDLRSLGIIIMRYVADMVSQEVPAPPVISADTSDPKSNVFIIINTNEKNLSSEDILPAFNINKVSCPRCRYRAEKIHNMLQSKIDVGKGDIRGICDHCKDKLSQEPCPICENIVKKFLDATNAAAKAATSWFKQKAPHVHRPISTARIAKLEGKQYFSKETPKSETDLKIELKLITQSKPETELLQSARLPEKHHVERKPTEEKRKVASKVCEFPSDESIITPFVTTFSDAEKTVKDSFKYIFPQDVKKKEDITKAALKTSSELIIDTQEKFLKQAEEEERKKAEEEERKKEARKTKFDLDISRDLYDKVGQKSEEDYRRKLLKEKPSLTSSAESKGTIGKGIGKSKSEKLKEMTESAGMEKMDKSKIRKKDMGELSSGKDISKDFKGKPPQKEKGEKDKEDFGRPSSKDIKAKKVQKDVGMSIPPKDIEVKKDQAYIQKPPSKDEKAKKGQDDVGKPQSKDVKVKKDQKDIGKPPSPPLPKEVKVKKGQEEIEKPPSKDEKAKKGQDEVGKPQSKDVKVKKDQKDIGKPPSPPLPKEVKVKKGQEEIEKPPSKDEKAKKGQDEVGTPQSKDVKVKKDQKDIGKPPSPPLPKEVKAKKGQEDIEKPPSKDEKAKKGQDEVGKPQSKDVKVKKDQKDIGKPPSPPLPKEVKAKKGQEEIEKPPPKDEKAKKGQDEVGKPQSKDVKVKKDQIDIGKPPSTPLPKEVKAKKGQEEIEKPPSKDEKAKKGQDEVGKPQSKDVKVKKDQKDIGKPPSPPLPKEVKAKKGQEDIEKPPSKDEKAKKGQDEVGKPQSKDVKVKKDQKDIGKPPSPPLPKEVKAKKGQEEIEKPPSKDEKAKKGQDEVGKPQSKDVKVKKDQKDIGKPPSPPLPKEVKAKKGQEEIEKPQSKDEKAKKGISATQFKGTKDHKDIGKPPPPPLPKKVKGQEDVEKPLSKSERAQRDKETEDRRAERKSEKDKGKIGKVLDDEKSEKKVAKEKGEIAKEEKDGKGGKGKEKGGRGEKDEVLIDKSTEKKTVPDILKYLPQSTLKAVDKALEKKKAGIETEQKMKEMQEACLSKAREEAFKKLGSPELKVGEYYLFKLAVKEPPEEEIKPRKKRKLKDFDPRRLKVRSPSYDNIILKMIKLSKEKKKKEDKKAKKHVAKYKIRSARRRFSYGSLSIDSDFELAFESLTNVIKVKPARYKIKHTSIVRDTPEKPERKLQPDPVLFHRVQDKSEPLQVYDLEEEEYKEPDLATAKGIIRYALSDRSFIDKGWTVLPTEKTMRKLNIYKVRPTNPELDWFNNNRIKGGLQYDTGEKLAEFDEDGRGRLYYKNGRLALNYYDCEETNAQQRFVVYSDGEPDERCRTFPVTVLAMFDYLGSGVVFDHAGKIRVKYNQTEGVILDRGLGPITRWKWHSLNDPPILKQVMIDTYMDSPDPEIAKLGNDDDTREEDEEMLKIELDNFIKEKTKKLSQKFQPFQIKMKALKLNEQFALKILDQAHIYLHFREGSSNSLKLNLGMVLDNQEIIDTETADYAEVANSLERNPPKTESILDLQNSIRQARRFNHMRTEHNEKIRPTIPECAADKLVSALSKPLRPPLTSSNTANVHGKPSQLNLYYDTRLI